MKSLFFKLALIASSALLSSCVTAPTELIYRHELADQILKPRPGYKGLTNRACTNYDEKANCVKFEVQDHDLADEQFRKTLNALGFICNVAGKRYKICEDQPGLCRIWFTDCGIFCKRRRHEEVIPSSNYQFLLDAKTRCFKKDLYPFTGSWGDASWGSAQAFGGGS